MDVLLSLCGITVTVLGIAGAAAGIVSAPWTGLTGIRWRCASFIVVGLFIAYIESAVLLGPLGLFSAKMLFILNGLPAWFFRARLSAFIADCVRGLRDRPFTAFERCLLIPFIFVLLTGLGTPVGTCDLYYHLPSTMYFVLSGSTATFDPQWLYAPSLYTNFYARGFEVLQAIACLFSLPRVSLLALKCLLMAALFCCLYGQTYSRRMALCLTAAFAGTGLVSDDMLNMKNDLFIGLMLYYPVAMLLSCRPLKVHFIIPCAALSLAVAAKATTLPVVPLVAVAWCAASWRSLRLSAILCGGLVVVCGLYFYGVNCFRFGNPVWPFPLSAFGHMVCDGPARSVAGTTVLANWDLQTIPLFLRGLLKNTGPLHMVLFAGLAGIIAVRLIPSFNKQGWVPLLGAMLLGAHAAVFCVTPFADNNTGVAHSQLFSGHTLRFLMAAFFLMAGCAGQLLTEMQAPKLQRCVEVLCLSAALSGLFWYDATSWIAKPENAFARMAPLAMSFDNTVLAAATLSMLALATVIAAMRRGYVLFIIAAFASVIWGAVQSPQQYGYAMLFKQMGKPEITAPVEQENNRALLPSAFVETDYPGSPMSNALMGYFYSQARAVHYADYGKAPAGNAVFRLAGLHQTKEGMKGWYFEPDRRPLHLPAGEHARQLIRKYHSVIIPE